MKYEPYLCNGCHDLMQKAVSFNDVAIVYVKGNAYRIHFWYMNRDDSINIMNNSNFLNKKGFLNFYFLFFHYERYYENDKEILKEQVRNKHKNLSEEEKNKRREYGKNRYHNMSEEKKQ